MFPIIDPTWQFFVVMAVVLLAPLLFERLRVPQIVGMILAGMLIGPHGLNILSRDSSFELFGQVGLYYIMFTAGLSMDIQSVKRGRTEVAVFGLTSFLIPFVAGVLLAKSVLDFSWEASVLTACILSSHTLVSFPIISRYGLTRHRGVTLSVGATMISLVLALLILAGLTGAHDGNAGWLFWLALLGKCILFVVVLCYMAPRLIRLFFRTFSDDVLQYIFVLALLFLCAGTSQSLGLEGVLGAFLVGLIFNRYIPETVPLMRHIDFMGNALFIPYFLIAVGMLINLPAMFEDTEGMLVVLGAPILALILKPLACVVGGRIFRIGRDTTDLTIGLTSGHAAGALAMVMVGRRLQLDDGTPLVDDTLLNAVVLIILTSCIFSAFVTTAAARRIVKSEVSDEEKVGDEDKILVTLHNPHTMPNLVNLALMMRPHRSTVPLVGVKLVVDAWDNERERNQAHLLVKEAAQIASSAGVNMKKVVRSGVNLITAMTYTMKDFDASEIIMGFHRDDTHSTAMLERNVNDLLQRVSRQIVFANFTRAISTIRCIHVVAPHDADLEVGFQRWVMHVSRLARQMDCRILFYATEPIWERIHAICATHYKTIRLGYVPFNDYEQLATLQNLVHEDHLLVVVAARERSFSYQNSFRRLPADLLHDFDKPSVLLIYPDQYGVEAVNRAFKTGFPLVNEEWADERPAEL